MGKDTKPSPKRRALILGLVAVLSAFLSTYASWNWGILAVNKAPVLPGLYFGLVLSFGAFHWVTKHKLKLFALLIATTVAWILAFRTADHVYELINSELIAIQRKAAPERLDVVSGYQVNDVLALSGSLGGLFGSVLTVVGVTVVSRSFYTGGNVGENGRN